MPKATRRIIVFLFAFVITLAASQIAHSTNLQITVTTDKETYGSNENILISGNLTLDDSPVSDGLVTLQVDDPEGNLTVIRTLPTGPDVAGPWPLEILEVIPLDENSNPCYVFQRDDYVGLKITVQNGLLERNVTITLNAYYRDEYPFDAREFTHQHMYPNQSFTWTQPYAFGPIALNAPTGTATVYVNAFTKWPRDGGFAYCPEKLATFNITSGTDPPVEPAPTSGNFNLSFKIFPGSGNLGNYAVYVSSYYPPFYATNSTTFELKIIGDITGPPPGDRFGAEIGDPNYDPRADLTGPTYLVPDGIINMRDISLIAAHFGDHV
jgi:hypothetical protein